MGYWNTRGLRGAGLEELINFTNEEYKHKGLAVIQKVSTPITPVKINPETKQITLAYFEKQSTVDYIGAAQGLPVCFDAKETKIKNLPFHNIHPHQIEFMSEFEKQGGASFFLVHFSLYDEYYYLPLRDFLRFWDEAKSGGRKSVPYDRFRKDLKINLVGGILDYLEALNTYETSK
ncbi:MAG: Holliday junction resolvase RecU [Clostridiales bacterium]|nr:Holliday junction resolvase RecU [Clostridiales bacterium]